MDDEAAINQQVDNRSVRYFDSHSNSRGRSGNCPQPITQLSQTRTTVRELAFADDAALGIDNTRLVFFRTSINAGKPAQSFLRHLRRRTSR